MNLSLLRSDSENDLTFLEHPEACVCFTGHRPERFIQDTAMLSEGIVTESIRTLLMMLIADTVHGDSRLRYFIIGMARGVDLWAGESLLFLKEILHLPIDIIAAFPNPANAAVSLRNGIPNPKYNSLLEITHAAAAVICCGTSTANWSYLQRNDYMLRHSSLLLGAYRDHDGGTGYTIHHAQKQGLSARLLNVSDYNRLLILLERYPEISQFCTQRQRYEFWQEHQHLLYQTKLLEEC